MPARCSPRWMSAQERHRVCLGRRRDHQVWGIRSGRRLVCMWSKDTLGGMLHEMGSLTRGRQTLLRVKEVSATYSHVRAVYKMERHGVADMVCLRQGDSKGASTLRDEGSSAYEGERC